MTTKKDPDMSMRADLYRGTEDRAVKPGKPHPARVQAAAAGRPQPKVTSETIGPREARKWLEKNTHNRPIRDHVVRAYARDMLAARWYPAVDVVMFDWNGILINGQHTLSGILEATAAAGRDIYINVIVVRDQDPAAQDVIDTQPKRTAGDQLALHGEMDSNRLAASLRLAMMLELFGSEVVTASRQIATTHQEIIAYLAQNPEMRHSISATRKQHLISNSISTALHYLMAKRTDYATATAFWDKLESGTGLEVGDPIYALRRLLENNVRASRKADRWQLTALVIKAWNATRRSQKLRVLTFREDEEFPVVN